MLQRLTRMRRFADVLDDSRDVTVSLVVLAPRLTIVSTQIKIDGLTPSIPEANPGQIINVGLVFRNDGDYADVGTVWLHGYDIDTGTEYKPMGYNVIPINAGEVSGIVPIVQSLPMPNRDLRVRIEVGHGA